MTIIVEVIVPPPQINVEVPAGGPGGGASLPTNLGTGARTASTLEVTSSTGVSAILPVATPTLAGLISAADQAAINALGTSSSRDVPASGNAGASQVVLGTDTRLSDSRTALPHGHQTSNITNFTAEVDARVAIGLAGVAPTTFTQPTPSTLWDVSHNLGRFPIINLKNLGTGEVFGQVVHVSANQFQVLFNNPQAGQAVYF